MNTVNHNELHLVFVFKQKTAYEMRISDWSSDVCSSDLGSLLLGNSMGLLKSVGGGIAKVFKGPTYKKQDYLDTIFLTAKLMKMMRTDGPVAMGAHIESPKESAIFGEFPKLLKDHFLIDFISDTIRLVVVSSGTLNVRSEEHTS